MFESIAYAEPVQTGAAAPAQSPVHFFIMMGLMIFVMYFLIIRPQQKRQKELQTMIGNLKKGDKVVTNGGLIGTVSSIQTDYIVMKTGEGEGTKIEVLKSAVAGLRQ